MDGIPLDELGELDQGARDHADSAAKTGKPDLRDLDEEALLDAIRTGVSYRGAMVRLAGIWAAWDLPYMEAERRLRAAFDDVPEADRHPKWHKRRADIPRILQRIYGKQAHKEDEQEEAYEAWEAQHPSAGNTVDDDHHTSTSWATPPSQRTWPEHRLEVFHGLAGRIVGLLMQHSEADPIALLIHFLVEVGNAIGRHAYYVVEADRHYPNLFALIVGSTSKARKGTAAGRAKQVLEIVDPDWAQKCVHTGLSTGEGLIWHVRDEILGMVATGRGANKTMTEEVIDKGVEDKRVLVVEAEFARTISVMERPGNTLSAVLRSAWDRGDLEIMTKTSSATATGAHVSIVGHITLDELQARFTSTDKSNGFGNRFLFAMVRRAHLLPFGGSLQLADLVPLAQDVAQAIEAAEGLGEVGFSQAARDRWEEIYAELSHEKPGLTGAVLARGEAQVVRLALIYALLEQSATIDLPHLEAARELWAYCEASAEYIFGDLLGDVVADEILRLLREAAPAGLTQTELSNLALNHHCAGGRIGSALGLLLQHNKVRSQKRVTGGRPTTMWFAL